MPLWASELVGWNAEQNGIHTRMVRESVTQSDMPHASRSFRNKQEGVELGIVNPARGSAAFYLNPFSPRLLSCYVGIR